MEIGMVKEWITKAGYRAKIFHNGYADSEWHCGYVEVPPGHPLYGLNYSDTMPNGVFLSIDTPVGKRGIIPLVCGVDFDKPRIDVFFDVHGGITYDGSMGKPGTWWFGFDCNHLHDNIGFCDEVYVMAECESLAEQLKTVQENAQIKSPDAGDE